MRTPRPFEAVIITWEDAQSDGAASYETPALALAAYEPRLRKSIGFWVGWAVKDGRRSAIIATDDDRRKDSPEALGGTSQIPHGMIATIEAVVPAVRRSS